MTKNKQTEVGEAKRSSSKQNKNMKLWDVPEVTSFVTKLSLRSTSLGIAKAGNLKHDFMAKHCNSFFGLNTFIDNMFWLYGHFNKQQQQQDLFEL